MLNKDNLAQTKDKLQLKWSIQLSCLAIIFLLILIASFFTGKLVGSHQINANQFTTTTQPKNLELELAEAKARLTMAEATNKLNSTAIEQTRQTILQLEQQIYLQQKQIISYKAIIAKQQPASNLVIRNFIVQATEQPHTYKYKLILTRIDQVNFFLTGQLQIVLEGTLNGQAKTIPLAQVTTLAEHKKNILFSFRYIALIPENNQFAEMVLPNDFIPKKIKITAYVETNKKPITKEFRWAVMPFPTAPSPL